VKYLQKSFSVYIRSQTEPHCYLCNKEVKVGLCSQLGYLCMECYFEKKKRQKSQENAKDKQAD
jgi:hypothetical protein